MMLLWYWFSMEEWTSPKLQPFVTLFDLIPTFGMDIWDWMTNRIWEGIVGPKGIRWVRRKFLRW